MQMFLVRADRLTFCNNCSINETLCYLNKADDDSNITYTLVILKTQTDTVKK